MCTDVTVLYMHVFNLVWEHFDCFVFLQTTISKRLYITSTKRGRCVHVWYVCDNNSIVLSLSVWALTKCLLCVWNLCLCSVQLHVYISVLLYTTIDTHPLTYSHTHSHTLTHTHSHTHTQTACFTCSKISDPAWPLSSSTNMSDMADVMWRLSVSQI